MAVPSSYSACQLPWPRSGRLVRVVMNPSDTNSISMSPMPVVACWRTTRPPALETHARRVMSTTSPRPSGVERRRRTNHLRLADEISRQVVQVGRLFDDLAAGLFARLHQPDPASRRASRRRRAVRRPSSHSRTGVRDVERAEVAVDADDVSGLRRSPPPGGRPARRWPRGFSVRDGIPARDQPLADRHRPVWRHGHVDDLRLGLGEHCVQVVVAGAPHAMLPRPRFGGP